MYLNNHNFLLLFFLKFWRQKNKKKDFYKNKKITKIDDIDVNEILVSKEEPYGTKNSFKYFIGHNGNNVIRPLCITLLQMTGYVRKFECNAMMSFKISNKQFLKKYNQIWKKVEKLLKIEFNSELVYVDNDKYIKKKKKNIQQQHYYKFSEQKNAERKNTM